MTIHAGLVAARRGGVWRGALIRGPSGSGKSDLMLRLLDQGLTLVADDRVILWASDGRVYGRAPASLQGRIEARGLDVLGERAAGFAEVVLIVDCAPPGAEIERVAPEASVTLHGVELPELRLKALEPSAPAKLRRALHRLGHGAPAP